MHLIERENICLFSLVHTECCVSSPLISCWRRLAVSQILVVVSSSSLQKKKIPICCHAVFSPQLHKEKTNLSVSISALVDARVKRIPNATTSDDDLIPYIFLFLHVGEKVISNKNRLTPHHHTAATIQPEFVDVNIKSDCALSSRFGVERTSAADHHIIYTQ